MAVEIKTMRGYISHNYGKSGAKYYKCTINVRKAEGEGWEWKRITGFTPYKDGDLNIAQILRAIPEHEYIEVKYYTKSREFESDGQKRTYTEYIVTDVNKPEKKAD